MTTKTKEKKGLAMTHDQAAAVQTLHEFLKEGRPLITLGGFAGTGKTTSIVEFVRQINGKDRPAIAFCAFTGRAASILRGKLEKEGILELEDYCGTIHGLIYKPVVSRGVIIRWERRAAGDMAWDLIIVDEGSMVNETIFNDLKSYEKPIIVVGDHGQLPPIDGAFNLMASPEIRLEKIHRQAEGDPIVRLSMIVREGGKIPLGRHGEFVSKTSDRKVLDRVPELEDVMILCGYNRTRVGLNTYVRQRLGRQGAVPEVGEKIICLKNNKNALIYNGMLGIVKEVSDGDKEHIVIEADMEGGQKFTGTAYRPQFGAEKTMKAKDKQDAGRMGDLFDFGYAMTVHKSQGSEARRVVVFEEQMPYMSPEDYKRWLYTAVTRAKERLLVIGT